MKRESPWTVEIMKNISMRVYGIEMFSSKEELEVNIEKMQEAYNRVLKASSSKRKTVVTMVKYIDEEKLSIVVAGYVKEEMFKEYQISAPVCAVVTVRGYSNGKIKKSIKKIREFVFNNWIKDKSYKYVNTEYILWTKERQQILEKNNVQVMFVMDAIL